MKKFTVTLLLIGMSLFTSEKSKAQEVFEEGVNTLSAGYGFVTFFGALETTIKDAGGTDIDFKNTGPFYVKFEHAVSDRVGFGINFAYATNEFTYRYDDIDENFNDVTYYEKDSRVTYSILARVNFHFGSADKFDPYVGVGMGYRDAKWTFETNDPDGAKVSYDNPVKFGFETSIGARYYLIPNLGFYGEVGLAKSIFQLGLVGKF